MITFILKYNIKSFQQDTVKPWIKQNVTIYTIFLSSMDNAVVERGV